MERMRYDEQVDFIRYQIEDDTIMYSISPASPLKTVGSITRDCVYVL
jgi:hypothetical protein